MSRAKRTGGVCVMLFYEPFFALILFPTFYALYLLISAHTAAKKWTLLIGSVAFYTWGEPLFVPIVLASSLLDFLLTRKLETTTGQSARHALLTVGIIANLGILTVYKYADFLISNVNYASNALGGPSLPLLHLALPIGVSFVVFEKISYLVDCYRGHAKSARWFSEYCLFVFLFPKLLAGPILKYHEMQGQIADPAPVHPADVGEGFLRFSRGIAKKVLIADPVGSFSDAVFASDATLLAMPSAWLGLVCFALQIYFDFSGYSDMAIGLARMLGFRLKENFDKPYVSRSLTEFWRRWHISLTSWIREYLYVPLGGSRGRAVLTYFNLWICFLASGIWHGASWNFVLWGAYNGLVLTLERIFLARWLERAGAVVSIATTLVVVNLGWAIFRTTSIGQLGGFLAALFVAHPGAKSIELPPDLPLTAAVAVFLCLFPATPLYQPLKRAYETSAMLQALAAFALTGLWLIACSRSLAIPFKPFLYFRF